MVELEVHILKLKFISRDYFITSYLIKKRDNRRIEPDGNSKDKNIRI